MFALGAAVGQSQKNVAANQQRTEQTDKGNPAKGKVVYQRNCAICHHTTSKAKKIGPGLKGVYKQEKFADGKPVNDQTMRTWIEDGGKDMPQFKNTLKPVQIADLIAYMRTL